MLGNKYRFIFKNPLAARAYMREWLGQCDINTAQTIAAGYIEMYSFNPEKLAEKFGGATYEIIKD